MKINPNSGLTGKHLKKFSTIEEFRAWRKKHIIAIGKINCFKKGYKHTQEWKNHISEISKGRKFTKEHKEKLSRALLGNKRNYKGGKYCLDCGKKLSSYVPIKCGSCSKRGLKVGGKNPNWRGGKSFELYAPTFNQQLKDRIRVRDNFKCQICGVPELELTRKLHIHHIDYDKKNCNETNLISLCYCCHPKVNYNRESWTQHFIEKIGRIYGCCIWA